MTAIATPVLEELVALCRRLRLKYVREQMPEVLLTAKAQRWDPAEMLRVLLIAEAEGRDRATIENRRKKAKFPAGKTFSVWDPARSPIPLPTQEALRSLEWVTRRENLVVCGPSGTGKSHFCEALGQHAIENGLIVVWYSIEDLGVLIRRHRIDDTITRAFTPILRADLVIVDDIGLLPISPDAAGVGFPSNRGGFLIGGVHSLTVWRLGAIGSPLSTSRPRRIPGFHAARSPWAARSARICS